MHTRQGGRGEVRLGDCFDPLWLNGRRQTKTSETMTRATNQKHLVLVGESEGNLKYEHSENESHPGKDNPGENE